MDQDEAIGILVLICIAVLIYMLPAVIAFVRGHPNRWVIFALNLFLGGTGIVWLGCLIWALMAVHLSNKPGGSNGGESGLNIIANDVMHVRLEPPALLPSRALPPPLLRDTTPSSNACAMPSSEGRSAPGYQSSEPPRRSSYTRHWLLLLRPNAPTAACRSSLPQS